MIGLRTLFLTEGILLLLFGAAALLLPPLVGLVTVILLGWLLIATGLIGMITTLVGHHAPGFRWSLVSAFVTLVVGAMMFAWPLGGLISLSTALGLFLMLDGGLAIGLAFRHYRHLTPRWAWLLFNGATDILFAFVVLLWLPNFAAWALGFFIGADMIIGGATLVALATDLEQPGAKLLNA